MSEPTQATDLRRVAEIDEVFATANGWGSWVVMAANDREAAVDRLRASGHSVEHKHLARTSAGERVD